MKAPAPTARRAPASPWLIAACLAAVYVIWGTTYYALKVGVSGMGPFFLLGTRFAVAGILMFAWLRLRGHPWPTAAQWRSATILGFLMLVIGLGGVTTAEQWVSSGAAVALISVMPLMTAAWSVVFGRAPRKLEWVAIAIGAAATLLMVTGADLRASPLGTGLILVGCFSWAYASVAQDRFETAPGASGFAAEMLAGGVMAFIVSAVLGESWSLPTSDAVWWAWGYLVVFGSVIAYSAYRTLVERATPTLASTYAYVNPPVALLVGWWLGGESFSPNVLIGLPIVLAAVGLLAWAQMPSKAAAATRRPAATAVGDAAADRP
jgi:drug/metabolite transporter (DMT)-like permease